MVAYSCCSPHGVSSGCLPSQQCLASVSSTGTVPSLQHLRLVSVDTSGSEKCGYSSLVVLVYLRTFSMVTACYVPESDTSGRFVETMSIGILLGGLSDSICVQSFTV